MFGAEESPFGRFLQSREKFGFAEFLRTGTLARVGCFGWFFCKNLENGDSSARGVFLIDFIGKKELHNCCKKVSRRLEGGW